MELDGFARLACDVSCIRCGHNLRGLRPDGVCCECGQSVDISLSGSQLARADPRWLERVCAGTGLLTLLLPWLWLPVVWPVVLVAGWLAAAPNPADPRRAARMSLALRSLLTIIMVVAPLATWMLMGPLVAWRRADTLAPLAVITALLVTWMVLLSRRLSSYVGEKRLRGAVRLLSVCWLGAVGLLLSAAGLAAQKSASRMEDFILTLSVLGIMGLLGGLVLLPITLIRLWRELDMATTLACSRRDRRHARRPATSPPPAATSPAASDAAPPAQP